MSDFIELGELENALPHGSGIDGDWDIDVSDAFYSDVIPDGETIQISNSYHVMDETGGYIGWIYFSFELIYQNDSPLWEMSDVELDEGDVNDLIDSQSDVETDEDGEYHGWGEWDADMLEEYLDETIHYSLKQAGYVK